MSGSEVEAVEAVAPASGSLEAVGPASAPLSFSFVLLLLLAGFMVYAIWFVIRLRSQRIVAAKAKYQSALDALKTHKNSTARIAALEAGREYAAVCRKNGRVTIFDEAKLSNDLTAYGSED